MLKKFPYRHRVSVLLFFLILITYLDRVCISLVGVRIKSAFNLSNEQFGWVLGAFALAYALFEIPSGMVGDRMGQRAVFIRIVLWWSLFTALTGAVTGFTTLIVTRFLFGMGEAGALPNTSAVIGRWFPIADGSKAMSIMPIGVNAGAAVAPFIVVPIAAAFGWRAPFFVNGLIGIGWVLVCWLWFRNEPSEMKGISAGEVDFIEKNRRQRNQNESFPWRRVLTSRNIWAIIISAFCSQWSIYFFVAWMPVYLQQGRHFSEGAMQLITSYLFIAGIAGALISGIWSDWLVKKKGLSFSRRFVGVLALGIIGCCFLGAATVSDNSLAVLCLMTGDFFFSFFAITSFCTCVDIGGSKAGTVAGLMNFCGQIGAFIMAIVFGRIVDTYHNYNIPLFVIAGVVIAGSITWFNIDPTKKIDIEAIEIPLKLTT